MKKVLAILSAGVLALLAVSCFKEEEKAVFDDTQVTAPKLGSYRMNSEEETITVNYTPAVLSMGFNEKMAIRHTLAIVAVDSTEVSKSLTTTDDGSTLTLKFVNLSKALINLGIEEGKTAKVQLVVRASLQEASKDNSINGFIDSEGRVGIRSFLVSIPEQVGSPYEEYTEASAWSLIGAMSAYEINWDGDLNTWANKDDNKFVAAHVVLKAGDLVKFRKDQAWTVNMGGSLSTVGEEFAVSQDGPNIEIKADGVYDLFLDLEANTAIVAEAYDPYPDYTQASTWSVIGSLPKYAINWDGDLPMVSDGTNHVAFGVSLGEADEFKFRKDLSWDVNFGGDFAALGDEFAVTQGGNNIKVGAEGVYDLFLNPDAATATVTEACGLKISSKIVAGEEPPAPEPVTGWNIIGLNGDWDNDVLATEDNNVWSAYVTAAEATEFKWRKDGAWDSDYGMPKDEGYTYTLGTAFPAVAGGANIPLAAGFYKVELNLSDAENPTITVSNGEVWSLIGAFNEWGGDVDMVLTDGKWVSPATKLDGEFKIRHNHDWAESVGGTFEEVGKPFAAISADGPNINVPAGTYIVTYDPTAATITIDELGWGLVGTINGWGGTPDIILKEEGLFLVAKNVTLTADDEIKLRYNQDWGVNRGATTAVGVPVKAEADGANIKPGAGTFDVYYRPDCEVIIVNEAGAALSYWGVVGTINGWGAPDKILYQNADGLLESAEIELTATDEIKIRQNEDWGNNRGGDFIALGEPFAVENGGHNIALGRDAKVQVVYDAANETITIKGEFVGDAPAFPDDIYAIGQDTGWSGTYQLHGKNGQYKGFGYLSDAFKFKPNADNWDGDWECVGEGQIGQGSDNCPAPATAGYYMIEVDLNEMTYKLTLITTIGIIGPAQAGGWDADTDLTYNAESGAWEASGVTLSAGDMKFRANDAWDINWGGALDALTQGGDNIAVAAGTYDVKLFALCDTKAYATLTEAAGPAAPSFAIDGDFSEWASIDGVAGRADSPYDAISLVKTGMDDTNIYVYMEVKKANLTLGGDASFYNLCNFYVSDGDDTGSECWMWSTKYDAHIDVWTVTGGVPKLSCWATGFQGATDATGDVVKYEFCVSRSHKPCMAADTVYVAFEINKQYVESDGETWAGSYDQVGFAPTTGGAMIAVTK